MTNNNLDELRKQYPNLTNDQLEYHQRNLKQNFKGRVRLFNLPPGEMNNNLTEEDLLDEFEPVEYENQILLNGLLLYTAIGPQSVAKLEAGSSSFTGGPIPSKSTFTDNQFILNPLNNLVFQRAGAWQETKTDKGLIRTFCFIRPANSYGGVKIDELGIRVKNLNGETNLLSRVIIGAGLEANGFTFDPAYDTVAYWDIEMKAT